MNVPNTPPGWYPSPENPNTEQLWDGQEWVGVPRAAQRRPLRSGNQMFVAIVLIGAFVIFMIWNQTHGS